jgi:hypothetical protein
LERGVGKVLVTDKEIKGEFGGFPQISGMKFKFYADKSGYNYTTNTGGSRVESVILVDENEKESIELKRGDDKTKIIFLCNDYTISEFPMLAKQKVIKEGGLLSDILAEHILHLTLENGGILSYPFKKNRINVAVERDSHFFDQNFSCEIVARDASGPMCLSNLTLSCDDWDWKERQFTTDENGKLKISLSFGVHKIAAKHGKFQTEILVTNISNPADNTLFFADETESDFESVANIIGQIPYNISLDDEKMIKFARYSYNCLDERPKLRVINYTKLESSEKKLSKLKGNYLDSVFKKNNRNIITASVFLIVSIALFFVMRFLENKKKKFIS